MIKKIFYYVIFSLLGTGAGYFISKFMHDEFFIDIKICLAVFIVILLIFITSGHVIALRNSDLTQNNFSVAENPEDFSRKSDIWGWLTPSEGPLKSGYALIKDKIIIGRNVKSDILINHESVSREHAEFTRSENGYHIKDLGSKNGIYVNNQRVKEYTLHDGDAIIIGSRNFSIKITQEITPALLPEELLPDTLGQTAVCSAEEEIPRENSNE